jgi:acetyl esterase/lipase
MAMSPTLPGRLGNSDLTLGDDPRADPRMVAAMTPLGMAARTPEMPLPPGAPLESVLAFIDESEAGFDALPAILNAGLADTPGVARSVEVIRGIDGNDITLYIHQPAQRSGPVPAVLHTHGGGMVMLEAVGPGFMRWRDKLAAAGLVVVGVEFRNAGGKRGPFPFPAGLNDCSSALQWLGANRAALGVSTIVLSGESGGGNLAIATSLKARAEGHLDLVAGVYAQCPYISNAYAEPPAELASLFENDGYFLSCEQLALIASAYDPTGQNDTNPMAWPYHATTGDLTGLPPHIISVNELDPLRDEGLAYHRKLLAAGVSSAARVVVGTCHAGDCLFEAAIPDVTEATIRDIAGFAHSL